MKHKTQAFSTASFWKGFLWANKQATYTQNVGNRQEKRWKERKHFWDIICFGPYNLALQFWESYVLITEQGVGTADTWDG